MDLKTKLKTSRKKCNLTQEQVAKKMNVSRKTVSSWETGRNSPDIETLIRLSSIYEIKFETLMTKNDSFFKKRYKNKLSINFVKISYYLNIILFILSFLNFFDPFGINMIWVTPALTINILIYSVINKKWKAKVKRMFKDKNSYFIFITFILVTLPLAIVIAEKNYNPKYLSAFIVGTAFHELTMTISFLIALYIHD